jgi:hypothetical protein
MSDDRLDLKRQVFAIVKEALERESKAHGMTVKETVNHNQELVVTVRRWPGKMVNVKLSVY